MEFIISALIISLLVTLLTTPLTIKLAQKYKLVDDPFLRPHPAHVQKRIIPRAGGLPIFLGLIVGIIFFVPFDKHIAGIILGTSVLLIIGILDDSKRDLSPYPRLLAQFLAAAIVVASGVGISFITNPFGGILRLDELVFPINLFGPHTIVLFADIFAFLWIVWMMNMVNWSKGVDGQMPGIVAVAALTIGSFSFSLYSNGDPNQLPIAILSFITVGCALGALAFNWYPSKILQGFSGSNILGFMIAILAILSGAKLAVALLVLLIPAIDFFYTIYRRLRAGKLPFYGDQKHLHHLLLNRGFSHPQISLFYILSCAILGLLALNLSSQGKLFIAIGLGTIILSLIVWLQRMNDQTKKDIESEKDKI